MKYNELTLGQVEAMVNKLGGMEGVKRFLASTVEVVFKSSLSLVATVFVPAQERFVAKERFVVNTDDSAEVWIAWMGDNFQNRFLGKIEGPVLEAEIAVHRLEKDLLDKEIRAELTTSKEEIALSQFYVMLARQGKGQRGELLVNGQANIAYIRDDEEVLWAVYAFWYADYSGWNVNAHSVEYPSRWHAGGQVLSQA